VQGATFNVSVTDGSFNKSYTATVGPGGTWSATIPSADAVTLANGTATVSAQVTDANGNQSAVATQNVTVAKSGPAILITTPIAGDNIINKSEAAAGVTISGTATAGSAAVNGQTTTITLVNSSNVVQDTYTSTVTGGAWSVNVTAAQAQALADGSYSVNANVSDTVGNAAATATQAITLDTLPPTVTISTAGTTTNQATQIISGTVAATEAAVGATVTLYDTVNGVTTQIGTAPVIGGTWSTSVTLSGYGTHRIVAQDTDVAGNTGASTPAVFTLALETIPSGGTISIGGVPSVTVDFEGTGGNLVLVSPGITGTISAISTASGPVIITGAGTVITSSGDAIDLTASGGTLSNPADLSIGLTGTITGAASGISVIQNAFGNIAIATSGPVIGQAGSGIFGEESDTGIGSILVDGSGNVTGTGSGNSGIFVEILNSADGSDVTVDQTGNISGGYDGIRAITYGNGNGTVLAGPNAIIGGSQLYGIIALSYGTGSLSVTTTTNDIVTSGSAGIVAQNDATSIPQVSGITTSSISVTAAGTINSGSALTATSFPPAGIIAGYNGVGAFNAAIFGNVVVNNSANINAAGGDGIRTFDYGNGNITVNDLANTTIAAPARYGILASVFGIGDISVSTSAGDTINSGSTGIQANGEGATVPSTSTVSVTAFGTINSGVVSSGSNNGLPSGIAAGYNNGGTNTVNSNSSNVQGNVAVDSSASIDATWGFGVSVYNFGVGNLTATLEIPSAIIATATGVNAYAQGGGNVTVTNYGTITVANGTGISAGTGNGAAGSVSGVVWVTNSGTVSALGSIDSPVIQVNNDSTQRAIFTNLGTITSDQFSSSSQNQAVGVYNGSVTVNNSGTITGNVSLAVGSSNLATATYNNNAGGIWNVDGSNYFGSGATAIDAINNAGTINVSGVTTFTASGTLAFNNSNTVTLQPNSYAYIGAAVAGLNGTSGTFSIGDFSTLEFGNSVAAGQTVSFVDGNASLALDSPFSFGGTISQLTIGDSIEFQGFFSVSNEIISSDGSTLTVTLQATSTSSAQVQTYSLSDLTLPSSVVRFSQLSADEIQLVPTSAVSIASSGPRSLTPSTQEFYILSNATISGSGGVGFNVASTDSTAGDFLTVEINQGSSISGLSGSFNGVNLTTTGANIAVINAGTITSAGGRGINTNSGTGSTVIVDNGPVSGATNGITANVSGGGQISIVVNGGVTVTGTSTFGISAVSLAGNVIINTSPGDLISSGSTGINAQDQGASIAQTSNSSISISAYGTIDSGATPPSAGNEPGGIKVGYNGGSNAPTTAVFGNVTVNNNASINAGGGMGIDAFNEGVGNISISDGAGAIITATAANTTVPGSAQYGIGAFSFEAGNISITAASGSTINSGSSGIEASQQASTTGTAVNSVTVVALGSLSSGSNLNNSGGAPSGIAAGFDFNGAPDANVSGNVFVNFGGSSLVAAEGEGIKAFTFGVGNINVSVGDGSSITAMHSGTSTTDTDNAPYGVGAFNYGPGNITVTTANGSSINSGSSGIACTNEAASILPGVESLVTVYAAGTINAGTIPTNSNAIPSGISAGYLGGTSATVNTAVNGDVVVNNGANINATNASPSSYGINAFNYGQGNVTVNDAANVTVIGAVDGINASANGGAAGDVAVNVSSGATINGMSSYGILANSAGDGNVSVTTSSGDTINSGSSGIEAVNLAATVGQDSSIVATAYGMINSGATATGSGNPAAGVVAAYDPGLANNPDGNVEGNILITDFASIMAAGVTDGIRGDNYGTGTVTIVTEAGATITAGLYGIAALGYDGGDLSVTNHATVIGTTAAIDATTTSTGTATIENFGSLTGEVISYNASFTNEAGGEWSFNGTSAFTGVSSLVNLGAIDSNGTSEISGLSSIVNSGTIEVQSGSLKLDAGISGAGALTIDAGSTLELASGVSFGETVTFSSTTGTLKLDSAQSFHGTVSDLGSVDGTQANSDQIDLANINRLSTSFSETFNALTDVLTVTDGTNTANIQFAGTVGNLNFVPDGNNGTIVYDPPVTAGQGIGPVVMHDPGPPSTSTIAATAPNQTLSGFAASDTFAFNFASVGQATVMDFHPTTDTLQFSSQLFANLQAALNATHDDGHGNTVIALDAHDTITLNGIIKAQLQASDFHFV